jgi:hypothetical protein
MPSDKIKKADDPKDGSPFAGKSTIYRSLPEIFISTALVILIIVAAFIDLFLHGHHFSIQQPKHAIAVLCFLLFFHEWIRILIWRLSFFPDGFFLRSLYKNRHVNFLDIQSINIEDVTSKSSTVIIKLKEETISERLSYRFAHIIHDELIVRFDDWKRNRDAEGNGMK